LLAYHSGNHVFIEISDDGAGIDKEKALAKALENGVVTEVETEVLTDKEIYELIMTSGFSTADAITDISGRGVGLDVVKHQIESLGGTIAVDAEKDSGSVFSIQLPLTLSIIQVLLVELGQEKYAIPLSSIIEIAIIQKDEIKQACNTYVMAFRGKLVPLTFLKDVFEMDEDGKGENAYQSVVII